MEIGDENGIVEAMIASKAMDDQAAYLSRGRQHSLLPLGDLRTLWTTTFKAWFYGRPNLSPTPIDDITAELAIRGESPPYDSVTPELDAAQVEIRASGPDASAFWAAIGAFILSLSHPKN
jgi:hypothetical protein